MRQVRLAVKLPVLIVVAVVLTAAMGGSLAIYLSRSVMRATRHAANAASVQSYASTIALYLEKSRTDLEAGVDLAIMAGSIPSREGVARVLRRSAEFEYVMLLRTDGGVDMLEPSPLEARLSRRNLAFMAWHRDVLKTGGTVVSDLHISPVTQRPTVTIATPVRDGDGQVSAILAGALKLEILSHVGRAVEAGAAGGWGYLTDGRGLIVAHQTKPKYGVEQSDFSSVPPVQGALAGRRGVLQFVNPVDGEEKLAAYMPLPGTRWAVVYSIPARLAFAPIGWLTNSIALASAALAALFGLGGIVLARQIVRPLRPLAAGTARVAAGDFAHPIEIQSTDEIGQLAAEFNRMTDALGRNEARLRRTNEELEVQYQRAQAANQLKSSFLANMSHELRTPLNGIIGFTEMMHDGKLGPITSEQRDYLDDVLRSARHLLHLINDILDLSKIESGKMDFRPEAVDLAGLVAEVTATVGTLATEKNIQILVDVDPDLTGIVTDPAKFKQVLYNFVSNALKFTPEGGRVAIRLRGEGPDRFRTEVEDTGAGIKPEDIDRLFRQFEQLDDSATK
jgi:signal transduction histidine kinase